MTIHELPAGKLYILSAPPGTGKSTFLERSNLPAGSVVSSDEIRERILGERPFITSTGVEKADLSENASVATFDIMANIVRTRLNEGLTTFVDATSVSETDRADWKKISDETATECEVLIFDIDLETALERNKNRRRSIDEKILKSFFTRFEKESALPYRSVSTDDSIKIVPRTIPHLNIDVIGDSHALYDDLVLLLQKAGWRIENGLPVHDDKTRKLLFLGDFIDRGPQGIEMVKFVKRCVSAGHLALSGNHENKVCKALRRLEHDGTIRIKSIAGAETICSFMEHFDDDERKSIVEWMRRLPSYFVADKDSDGNPLTPPFAFTHADVPFFDPLLTLSSDMLYGTSGFGDRDSDGEYDNGFKNGLNSHVLIRGHIPATNDSVDSVFSLDDKQAFAGNMLLLRLDGFVGDIKEGKSRKEAFESNVLRQKCEFDFKKYAAERFQPIRELERLSNEKLVTRTIEPSTGLVLWKFSKSVFWDAKWDESEWLLRARGHVTDITGKVVQNPFDKIFNYGERGTGENLSDSTKVIAALKMNGFMGCISSHPYKKGQLLVTTSGSFESPFVERIRDFLDAKTKGKTISFLSRNNLSLMFEVIHPTDPHIISYGEEDMGLWLIGARTKEFGSPLLKEAELDEIAKEIGFKRVPWFETTLGDVRERGRTEENEGYVLRIGEDETPLLKIKSTYYLVTKFLGRMGLGNIKFMYNNPTKFKENVDEEFYSLVDSIVGGVPQDEFSAMPQEERVLFVRGIIDSSIRDKKRILKP